MQSMKHRRVLILLAFVLLTGAVTALTARPPTGPCARNPSVSFPACREFRRAQ